MKRHIKHVLKYYILRLLFMMQMNGKYYGKGFAGQPTNVSVVSFQGCTNTFVDAFWSELSAQVTDIACEYVFLQLNSTRLVKFLQYILYFVGTLVLLLVAKNGLVQSQSKRSAKNKHGRRKEKILIGC